MRVSEPSPERVADKRQEAEKLKQREALKQRLKVAQPSQSDVNELVMLLAREHGLIGDTKIQKKQ